MTKSRVGKRAEARIAELRSWIRIFEAQRKQAQALVGELGKTIDAMEEEVMDLMLGKKR